MKYQFNNFLQSDKTDYKDSYSSHYYELKGSLDTRKIGVFHADGIYTGCLYGINVVQRVQMAS